MVERIRNFYLAPVIRFVYNTISYVTFLAIFSYLLLFEFNHQISMIEYVVIGWMVTLLFEEIRQILTVTMAGISFSTYISDSWNKLDCIAVGLFVIGFTLRMISLTRNIHQLGGAPYDMIQVDDFFVIARICYAFSLFAFYIRLMYIFSFHIALGPKLIMIGKMVINDLVPFMVILVVFIMGYGVAAQSIAYPAGLYTPLAEFNGSFPDRMSRLEVVGRFLTRAYFQMFGDFGLETIQAEDPDCKDEGRCPHYLSRWLVPIMLGIYVLLTNILMFNLLIAMFSSTYESINQFSALHWNYQRYSMIKEYLERSPLAPPLIIFWHGYELLFQIHVKQSGRRRADLPDPLKVNYKDNQQKERELIKWEHMKAMDYLRTGQESQQQRKGGRDSRSVIVRTSGGAAQPGAGAMDMAKQMTDATSGIGMELEKKFKTVDAQLGRLGTDLEAKINDLAHAVQETRSLLTTVRDSQSELLQQISQQQSQQQSASSWHSMPSWFAEAVRQATEEALTATPVAVRRLDSPVVELLRASQQPQPPPPPEPSDTESNAGSDSSGGDDDAPPLRPQVADARIGRVVQHSAAGHRLWRLAPFNFEQYPGMRMNVPADRIPWEVQYKDYFAYDASDERLVYPSADSHDGQNVQLQSIPFNQYDSARSLKRQSMVGRYRLDNTGAPLNPMGRTGLMGKGHLPRWGPNNGLVVMVTRWSRAASGAVIYRLGKPILQVLTLFRHKQFCLPWFLTDHTATCNLDHCSTKVLRSFISKRLQHMLRSGEADMTPVLRGRAEQAVRRASFSISFTGYLDDHLNADNAWMEAVAVSVHESDGWRFSDVMLKVFAEDNCDEQVKWMEVAYSTGLRPSHAELLKSVADKLGAYF